MKQAVILAAGEGQRLRPFTVTKPKVMLAIAGKPILQYVIESLARNGVRNIVLVVGYKKEQIFDYISSGEQFGVEITYVTQERQVGTAHALAQTKDVVEDEFLVLPGDNLIEADTITRFVAVKPDAMLVKRVDDPSRYGVVTVADDLVKGVVEKPVEAQSNIVNTGIYAFTTEIFDVIEAELDIPDVINKMLVQGHPINVQETKGTWLDVVYPWDILKLNDAVIRQIPARSGGTVETGVSIKGLVSVGEDTVIRSGSYIVGPVVIGDGCDVGSNVCIMPATSIGDNVVISSFSEIKNSVISSDVSIGSSCIIQDSIVDKGCMIKGHFIASSSDAEVVVDGGHYLVNVGAMLGEGCNLGSSVVARSGTIVGNYSQVQALKLISGRLPDRSLVF
jgi:UDP-N-acetylglucosamine diphosphorylase/glucosamine-1-phosphate N-acetyltransferase